MSDGRIRFLDPVLLANFVANLEALEDNGADIRARRFLRRQATIIATIIKGSDLLFVPINAGGHWTLLVYEAKNADCRLRYYDTLKNESELCRLQAQSYIYAFGLVPKEIPHVGDICDPHNEELNAHYRDLPRRRNSKGRQEEGSNQCGYCIMWYVEEEVRHFRGEGWGGRGNLKGPAVRRSLHNVLVKLLPWQVELIQRQRDFEEYVARCQSKADENAEIISLMHQETMLLSHEQGRTALEELTVGVEGLPPLLVIPPKPLRKAKAKSKSKNKAEVEEPMLVDLVSFEAPSLPPLQGPLPPPACSGLPTEAPPLPPPVEDEEEDDLTLERLFSATFLAVLEAGEVLHVEEAIWKDELKKPPFMHIGKDILEWADSRLAELPEDCRKQALKIRALGAGACGRCHYGSGSSELKQIVCK